MPKLLQTTTLTSVAEIVAERTGMPIEYLLDDPTEYHINNLDEAVDLFVRHAKDGSHILVYGDYDGDGIGSCVILDKLCRIARADYEVRLPDRESDGYGIQEKHVDGLKKGDLLICVDNGIAAFDAIKKAKELGCDVLVLDHHEGIIKDGTMILPEADVIVDPHITGGTFDDYCGAGLSFKFAEKFFETRVSAPREKWEPILKTMNVFAAISTITDSVKLTWENRKIVRNGFKYYKEGYVTTGLKTLCDKLWMPKVRNLSGDDIGFTLGPAWNAAGRLLENGADLVFKAMSYDGPVSESLLQVCDKLKKTNDDRRDISNADEISDNVYIKETGQENDGFIVVYEPGKLPGIAGIRAGRITEKYKVPSMVFTDSDVVLLKGSGRSVLNVNLMDILTSASVYLEGYGGHPEACGASIKRLNLKGFTKAVKECISKSDIPIDNNIKFDVELLNDMDIAKYTNDTIKYGPYGVGNEPLRFLIRNVQLLPSAKGYFIGQNMDTLSGCTAGGIKIMGFRKPGKSYTEEFKSKYPEPLLTTDSNMIDAVVTLGEDEYKGTIGIKLTISDFTFGMTPELEHETIKMHKNEDEPIVGE